MWHRQEQMAMSSPDHIVELRGCTPEPLMAYLKGLGILRLVSEQRDTGARGWWKGDVFLLRSCLDGDALVDFFLREYEPTPVVAPWAGGSGFFAKDNRKAVDAIAGSRSRRLENYRAAISTVRAILSEERVTDKPSDKVKARLIQRYRRELPLQVIDWMDAAMVLQERGQAFAPVLGTGGNDGRLDFTQNFMSRLVTVGIVSGRLHRFSEQWLRNALFGDAARLETAAVGQFAPGRAGGPNATQGMEGDATDNPWDFILMLEGTLMLAGAPVRRLEAGDASRASFPFTVRAVAAGYASAGSDDERQSRGEMWLPLWDRPVTTAELRTLFAEGRGDVSGRPARNGLDFARAAATLGVDRGIRLFIRYSFLKRSGKAHLASPLGRFEVRERTEVDLLREVDPWLHEFRRAAGDKNAPPRFQSALRRIDQAIFDLCRYGGRRHLQAVLVALGRAERELALTSGMVGRSKVPVRPLYGLSQEWIARSDDGSPEFAIAGALAAIHDPERKIGPFRVNLEPVSVSRTQDERLHVNWIGQEQDPEKRHRAVVWNHTGLVPNLERVLERRCVDGQRVGCKNLPLAAPTCVGLDAVAAFVNAEIDDAKVEDLIWGLILADGKGTARVANSLRANGGVLPRAYALVKLLFLPRPLAVERSGEDTVRIRLVRSGEQGIRINPEVRVLYLLKAGRLGEACVIAVRRLRAAGLSPLPHAVRGARVRDDTWRELQRVDPAAINPRRLEASLLFPISEDAVAALGAMVASPEVSEGLVGSETI